MFEEWSAVRKLGVLSLVTAALALLSFSVGLPLWVVSSVSLLSALLGISWLKTVTKGYTQTTRLTVLVFGVCISILTYLGFEVHPGIASLVGVPMTFLVIKSQRSKEEARRYWFDEEERRRLEAQKGWRP